MLQTPPGTTRQCKILKKEKNFIENKSQILVALQHHRSISNCGKKMDK
jgi:hypothetical protein